MPKTAKKSTKSKKCPSPQEGQPHQAPPASASVQAHRASSCSAPVPSDIDIAQAGKLKPILQIAEEIGLQAQRAGAVRPVQGQSPPGGARPAGEAHERQVHRRDRHHAHAAGRRQDHHHGRPVARRWARIWARSVFTCIRQPVAGSHLRHQGRRGRRRLQPDHSDGGFQPAPDRRHPRHHRRQQPAGRRHRCAHVPRSAAARRREAVQRLVPAR